MIACLAYCLRDEEITLDLAKWVQELSGCPSHELFLIHDRRCNKNLVQTILDAFIPSFKAVYPGEAAAEIDGWPQGANYFFRLIACELGKKKQYADFLWLEPDAIPLSKRWMDKLEYEYLQNAVKKPFMGDRVEVENVDLHMSGVGVYPNPLYVYSGLAYSASDLAWDMAGREEIVPKAHFTKLIEHAWKHPSFTDPHELETQIRPEAVLFHSSKDGSLIKLLREKLFPAVPVPVSLEATSGNAVLVGEAREGEALHSVDCGTQKGDSRGGRETTMGREATGDNKLNALYEAAESREDTSPSFSPTLTNTYDSKVFERLFCDIFIRTYPGDYPWLRYCLQAIDKFAKGFRKIWIISPQDNPIFVNSNRMEWKMMNDETEDGYLAQQISKLYADVNTDYEADYILHIDSDVILSREICPENFLTMDGKVIWPYTPYSAIQTPWQPIIEKFMDAEVENEFMRRLPIMIPKWLYPRLREFCHRKHGMVITDYVRNQPIREFSEFNALGAYAWKFHHDKIAWINTKEWKGMGPPTFARQYRSWSGITPEVKAEIETILSGGVESRHAGVESTKELVGTDKDHCQVLSGSSDPPAQTLPSILPSEERKRNALRSTERGSEVLASSPQVLVSHNTSVLPKILEHIKEGDMVVDAGAFTGEYTAAFSKAVGEKGFVYAFEPNPTSYECLYNKVYQIGNVKTSPYALSDGRGKVPLSGNNGVAAGVYVGDHMKITDVETEALEIAVPWRVNFIKIDVEGYELKVLRGAGNLINRCKPKMAIEINEVALARQGDSPGEIFAWLERHGYQWTVIQEDCTMFSPLYDIIALPSESNETVRSNGEEGMGVPSDLEKTLGASISLRDCVNELQKHSESGREGRRYVMRMLKKAGLWPKR